MAPLRLGRDVEVRPRYHGRQTKESLLCIFLDRHRIADVSLPKCASVCFQIRGALRKDHGQQCEESSQSAPGEIFHHRSGLSSWSPSAVSSRLSETSVRNGATSSSSIFFVSSKTALSRMSPRVSRVLRGLPFRAFRTASIVSAVKGCREFFGLTWSIRYSCK